MKTTTKRLFGLVLGLVLVLVLIAVSVLNAYANRQLAKAVARFEAEAGPLDPAAYAPPDIDREDNAATWYLAAAHALVLSDEDTIRGLVVMVVSPDDGEVIFTNIAGTIDLRQLARLGEAFDLPGLDDLDIEDQDEE